MAFQISGLKRYIASWLVSKPCGWAYTTRDSHAYYDYVKL